MFEIFQRNSNGAATVGVDRNLVRDRIADALRDGGMDPDGKNFAALFKLLSDDIDWYFDQTGEAGD